MGPFALCRHCGNLLGGIYALNCMRFVLLFCCSLSKGISLTFLVTCGDFYGTQGVPLYISTKPAEKMGGVAKKFM